MFSWKSRFECCYCIVEYLFWMCVCVCALISWGGLPQEIGAHTYHRFLLAAWNNMAVFKELFKSDFYKLNCIYKDSETLSLSTTITIPFSISLTRKYYLPNIQKQERHYPHNLSSNITLYFIHSWKTEHNSQSESSLSIATVRIRYSTMQ